MSYILKSAYPECKGARLSKRDLRNASNGQCVTIHTDYEGTYTQIAAKIKLIDLNLNTVIWTECTGNTENIYSITFEEMSDTGDFGNLMWFTKGWEKDALNKVISDL